MEIIKSLYQFITIFINTHGKNNKVNFNGAKIKKLKYHIIGNGNSIKIDKNNKIKNLSVIINGSNNNLLISGGCKIESIQIEMWSKNGILTIGSNCTIMGAFLSVSESNTKLQIGNECLFASDIEIRTGDSHAVYDLSSGERLNKGKSITIGDSCWLAKRVMIMKGGNVPSGSIVSAGSIVTKELLYKNCIYAGVPAQLKRRDVNWSYSLNEKIKFAKI